MTLIACGQLRLSYSLAENGAAAVRLIARAAAARAAVLFLPEASDYLSKSAPHLLQLVRPVTDSPFVQAIQTKLQELHAAGVLLHVSVGVHEPTTDGKRVKNTLLWLDPQGSITQRYQKLHLFDVAVPNGPIMQESKSVEPGNEIPTPYDSPAGKIGPAICYDIRFPELALELRRRGAQILTFPSAFTVRTGAAHWHLLARARAIDTQSYVVMAAQAGTHTVESEEDRKQREATGGAFTPRVLYGHALVVDPWGTIVAECLDINAGEDVCFADIDLDRLEKVRRDMPLWEQRRDDVFGPKHL